MNDSLLIAYSAACAFFARVLRPGLDVDLLRRCAADGLFASWPLAGAGTNPSLAVIAGALGDLGDDRIALLKDDNTALFIGPQDPVPMWESVWTTEDRLLFEDCTTAVEAEFAAFGFEIHDPVREPSDHLAYELAFVSALLARAAEHIRAGEPEAARRLVDAAVRFTGEHLAGFASACLGAIAERAGTDFYRGVARLCADTLAALPSDLAAMQAGR